MNYDIIFYKKQLTFIKYAPNLRNTQLLAKLAKLLSCVVCTYLYGAFDCMLVSCHVRVSE